eukprot:GHVT01031706.1.p3 GENE.GHVT01031706.1~~GHVT01031706.1.p3  ORF type:complete len:112 (-),score=21.90 GHVT01031706.1:1932-2267(-)
MDPVGVYSCVAIRFSSSASFDFSRAARIARWAISCRVNLGGLASFLVEAEDFPVEDSSCSCSCRSSAFRVAFCSDFCCCSALKRRRIKKQEGSKREADVAFSVVVPSYAKA